MPFCLLCGVEGRDFTDEHVFPAALGGGLVVPNSTGSDCNNGFSKLEQLFAKELRPIRLFLKVPDRYGNIPHVERRTAADAPRIRIAARSDSEQRDVFISHASEDKPFARQLADELASLGLTYWLDEREITVGDSLREVIDGGLRNSRYGVVILSQHFFAKQWPQRELDGLLALEIDKKVILPVWHGIGSVEIRTYSPMLAGRYAARSSEGADIVAAQILAAVRMHAG